MSLKTKTDAGVATVTIDHPPVNAPDSHGWNRIATTITELGRSDDVHCIILNASGKGFCAGADVKELAADGSLITQVNAGCWNAFAAIHDCQVPVVAACHGYVLGGGIGLAGSCDIIVASDDATFGLPEIDRGALGAASHLMRMFPIQKVRKMLFTGEPIDAAEAYRLGALEWIGPRAELMDAAHRIADSIASKSPRAMKLAKECMNGIELLDIKTSYRFEQGFTLELYTSPDSQEARNAFVEKRDARFSDDGYDRQETDRNMDLTYTDEQRAFRAEVRSWLEAHVPKEPLPSFDTAEGFAAHREWERELNAGGYAMVPWPVEYGGRGADLLEWLIFEEEYYRAGAPGRVNQNGIFLLGPTIMEYGTDEQRARYLPKMASSEEVWAQGWSEPNAGSDMAAIQATAVVDGDDYVINGQKTWASRGAYADWLFGMFRTDPDSERHRGLTFILVPLDLPGVTVRPIEQLDGEAGFAEVFLDDVRVSVANRLGAPNKGWDVAMATAGFERGLMLRSPARFQNTARKLVELYRATEAAGLPIPPGVRDDVARAWIGAEAYTLNTYQTVSHLLAGGKIGSESSLNKIFWSELDVKMHETALSLLGARAELLPGSPAAELGGAPGIGDWLDGYLFALSGPIYAGTNEVQRNIIAERILGLPRK